MIRFSKLVNTFPYTSQPRIVQSGYNTINPGEAFWYYGGLFPQFYFNNISIRFPNDFKFCPLFEALDPGSICSRIMAYYSPPFTFQTWMLGPHYKAITHCGMDTFFKMKSDPHPFYSPMMFAQPEQFRHTLPPSADRYPKIKDNVPSLFDLAAAHLDQSLLIIRRRS
jgi:hypothetical protein